MGTAILLTLGVVLAAQTPAPSINEGGVVEAAQFGPAVAPGAIASAFGANLAAGVFEAEAIPLPAELGGARVEANGVAAPLYFVSGGQINFQVPFETELGEARIVAIRDGAASAPRTVQVEAYAPVAYRNAATGEAIVVAAGSATLIDAAHPAVAGQIVTVFMNGYGRLDNTPPTGAAAAASPLSRTLAVPRVTLGGLDATVFYAGLTPGLVGLGQLDIGLPERLPSGVESTLPLRIDFDGFTAPVEEIPVVPNTPDAGIEITSVAPSTVFPGDSVRVDYRLLTPSGHTGPAEVTFYLQVENQFATLERFEVQMNGVDVALTRQVAIRESLAPGAYTFFGQVAVPGDANRSNDTFAFAEPFVIQARSGEPHDVGVQITGVAPLQIAPGGSLTFDYTLLNLTGYRGPVTVVFQLSSSAFGRILLTEQVELDGAPRQIVRQVPTPADLTPAAYRPVVRVQIENDIAPGNNTALFGETVAVAAPAPLTWERGAPPPLGDLAEGNPSEWRVEASAHGQPAAAGVRFGGDSSPMSGSSLLVGVAPAADRLVLAYPRPAALAVNWDLSGRGAVEFWMAVEGRTEAGSVRRRIVLRSAGGSRTLTAAPDGAAESVGFARVRAPLDGGEGWGVSEEGDFDPRRVTAVEFEFASGAPGGLRVSLDGVHFAP